MESELTPRVEAAATGFLGRKLDLVVKESADATKAAKYRPKKDFIVDVAC